MKKSGMVPKLDLEHPGSPPPTTSNQKAAPSKSPRRQVSLSPRLDSESNGSTHPPYSPRGVQSPFSPRTQVVGHQPQTIKSSRGAENPERSKIKFRPNNAIKVVLNKKRNSLPAAKLRPTKTRSGSEPRDDLRKSASGKLFYRERAGSSPRSHNSPRDKNSPRAKNLSGRSSLRPATSNEGSPRYTGNKSSTPSPRSPGRQNNTATLVASPRAVEGVFSHLRKAQLETLKSEIAQRRSIGKFKHDKYDRYFKDIKNADQLIEKVQCFFDNYGRGKLNHSHTEIAQDIAKFATECDTAQNLLDKLVDIVVGLEISTTKKGDGSVYSYGSFYCRILFAIYQINEFVDRSHNMQSTLHY